MISLKTPLTNKYFSGSDFSVCTATTLSLLSLCRKNPCTVEAIFYFVLQFVVLSAIATTSFYKFKEALITLGFLFNYYKNCT